MLKNKEASKKRINKRGLTLLQFIVDLVIGIVCLIIIFTLFSAILNIFFFANERQKAEATISRLAQYLQTAQEGQSINFLFYVPKGWWFVSISDGEYSDKIPLRKERIDKKCQAAKSNCICICRDGFGFWNGLDCSSGRNSYCEIISRPFIKDGDLFAFKIQLEALTIIKKKEAYFVDKFAEYNAIKISAVQLSNTQKEDVKEVYQKIINSDYYSNLKSEAENNGFDQDLIVSIIIKESSGNSNAVSCAGAAGLMQLMPDTARGHGLIVPEYDKEDISNQGACSNTKGFYTQVSKCNYVHQQNCNYNSDERFNPEKNIKAGIAELKQLQDKYQDINLVLAGYNAGPEYIKKCGTNFQCYPKETQNYIPNVLAYRDEISIIQTA